MFIVLFIPESNFRFAPLLYYPHKQQLTKSVAESFSGWCKLCFHISPYLKSFSAPSELGDWLIRYKIYPVNIIWGCQDLMIQMCKIAISTRAPSISAVRTLDCWLHFSVLVAGGLRGRGPWSRLASQGTCEPGRRPERWQSSGVPRWFTAALMWNNATTSGMTWHSGCGQQRRVKSETKTSLQPCLIDV